MSDQQPRTCHGCGEKLVLAHPEPLWFDTMHLESWHFGCKIADLQRAA